MYALSWAWVIWICAFRTQCSPADTHIHTNTVSDEILEVLSLEGSSKF